MKSPGAVVPFLEATGKGREHSMRTIPYLMILPLACILVSETTHSLLAAEPQQQRPRIGLALSGGGAKGCAHVGVLAVLEELHVPIDYIAGTSMGSIVGGLYACGFSAAQLEELVSSLDWDELLEDEPSRRDRSYRRKLEDQRYILGFETGLKRSGFVFPSGLKRGHKLLFELRRLTLPAVGIARFDELPISFAAVATDITTGEMVVLDSGDLALSLRASMSIPGVFAPVELDDRLLVDGGLVRNLPVDIVRAMGADVVIAVDVGTQLLSQESLKTLFDISSQAMGVTSRSHEQAMIDSADIVLQPEVGEMGSLDFSQAPAIVLEGKREAERQRDVLARLGVSDPEWSSSLAERPELPQHPLVVTSVIIEGRKRLSYRRLRSQIHLQPQEQLDLDVLEADLRRIYGLGDVEWVDFELLSNDDGYTVDIKVKEKSWGPLYVHTGLNIGIDDDENTSMNLIGNLTMRPLNDLAAEWKTDLMIGSEQLLHTELMQPLDYRGRFFVLPQLTVQRHVRNYQLGDAGSYFSESESTTAAFDLGLSMGTWGELRGSIFRGRTEFSYGSGSEGSQLSDHVDVGGYAFHLLVDRLDSAYFPRRGMLATVEHARVTPSLGATDEFTKTAINHVAVKSWGRHTLGSWIEAGTTSGDEVPGYAWFPLGGLFSFSSYEPGELVGPHYGVYRPFYIAQVADLPSFIGKGVYIGGWLEAGNVWDDPDQVAFDTLRWAGTVMLGAETVVGPAYLAITYAEEGRSRIYLAIGPSFGGGRPGQ